MGYQRKRVKPIPKKVLKFVQQKKVHRNIRLRAVSEKLIESSIPFSRYSKIEQVR